MQLECNNQGCIYGLRCVVQQRALLIFIVDWHSKPLILYTYLWSNRESPLVWSCRGFSECLVLSKVTTVEATVWWTNLLASLGSDAGAGCYPNEQSRNDLFWRSGLDAENAPQSLLHLRMWWFKLWLQEKPDWIKVLDDSGRGTETPGCRGARCSRSCNSYCWLAFAWSEYSLKLVNIYCVRVKRIGVFSEANDCTPYPIAIGFCLLKIIPTSGQ